MNVIRIYGIYVRIKVNTLKKVLNVINFVTNIYQSEGLL